MRLKNDTENFAASFNITPPYQMRVIHSSKLIYPREIYQRGVQRKRVELIAADFNEYVANEPKISFRNGKYYVVDGQHTIEARILRNGGRALPILCKVYTGMTMQQEALLLSRNSAVSATQHPAKERQPSVKLLLRSPATTLSTAAMNATYPGC